jgi:hypothetical protein
MIKFQRKRWFMAPWFVWAFLDLISLLISAVTVGEVILTFLESPILGMTLLVILMLLVLGKIKTSLDFSYYKFEFKANWQMTKNI